MSPSQAHGSPAENSRVTWSGFFWLRSPSTVPALRQPVTLPWRIGGTIDIENENYTKRKDLRHSNYRLDMTFVPSLMWHKGDKLLLSPGASPVVPPLPGINSEGIFTLRNVSDTDRIKAFLDGGNVHRAVIVGGGFIGLEMAENLKHAGLDVAVVEMANQVMGPIDYSMAALVHEHLQEKGVKLYLEQAVESFSRENGMLTVHFKSGITLETDMVLLSIGVRAETRLAQEAGLRRRSSPFPRAPPLSSPQILFPMREAPTMRRSTASSLAFSRDSGLRAAGLRMSHLKPRQRSRIRSSMMIRSWITPRGWSPGAPASRALP